MAEIVLGVGTSHSPMLAVPGESWTEYASRDRQRDDLVYPPEGRVRSYDDGRVALVEQGMTPRIDREEHIAQYARCRGAIDALATELERAAPDVVVMVSDDQEEWFYESNMPMFSIYWGGSVPLVPRPNVGEFSPELNKLIAEGYGDVPMDIPVASELGRHVIEHLVEHDFDIAHATHLNDTYGGQVARRYPGDDGVLELSRERPSRRVGLPHGFAFVIKNLLGNRPHTILPVSQNTCYPPNAVTPRRALAFGKALGGAIRSWDVDLRVAVVASGGLSHFVTDEQFDRELLEALAKGDEQTLASLPGHRLYSGTSESLNWVTVAGAMSGSGLSFRLADYVPVYRSDAGTGGGWAFATWI